MNDAQEVKPLMVPPSADQLKKAQETLKALAGSARLAPYIKRLEFVSDELDRVHGTLRVLSNNRDSCSALEMDLIETREHFVEALKAFENALAKE